MRVKGSVKVEAVRINSEMSEHKKSYDIVRATPGDGAAMVEYINAAAGETDFFSFGQDEYYHSAEQEAAHVTDVHSNGKGVILLAKHVVTGEIMAQGKAVTHGRRGAHVFEIALSVRKAFWRMGIGKALMLKLEVDSRPLGAEKLSLGVDATNAAAVSLYEALGYVREGVLVKGAKKFGKYVDIVVMGKFI